MYHLSLSQVLVNFIGKCCTKLWTLIVVEVRDILSFHRAKTMLPPVEFCRNKQAMLVKMLTTMHTKKKPDQKCPNFASEQTCNFLTFRDMKLIISPTMQRRCHR